MKRVLVSVGLIGLASAMAMPAFAGKEEREFLKTEVMPAVKTAEANYKSSCGCALAITVDEASLKSTSDMRPIKSIAEHVSEGVTGYCTDAASKKAMCRMKTLVLAKAAEAAFTFKNGKGVATTDGQSTPSWEMLTAELDK